MKMALGNEKISISENIVKVVGAKEFKVRRVKNCSVPGKNGRKKSEQFLVRIRFRLQLMWIEIVA